MSSRDAPSPKDIEIDLLWRSARWAKGAKLEAAEPAFQVVCRYSPSCRYTDLVFV